MPFSKDEVQNVRESINDPDGKLTSAFNAVSDPTRCRIFRLLMVMQNQDISVGDIAHIIGVSMPAISQHLKILESAGLVNKERKAQNIFYKIKINDDLVDSLVKIIRNFK